jgi:CheY-like chemotaxis protein
MARILVVDDEPDVLLVTRIMLKRDGHEIDEARDGTECLEKLKKEKYDLILLDVMLPGGMNGWKVCEKIKANGRTKNTPVVMFTVRTGEDDVKRGRRAGADAQIDKPFGEKEFRSIVAKVLKGR